jgi:cytochrome P450
MTAAITAHTIRTAPGPRGNPIFGNLSDLRRDPLTFYPAMRAQYGDVVRFRGMRNFNWFLVSYPDDIERILKGKAYPKGLFVQTIKVLVGNGLLTSEGEFWRQQRRLAQPAFHRRRLETLAEMMTAAAERTNARLEPAARSGKAIDITHEMMRLTLEIVGRALFSVDVSGAADDVGRALTIALEHVNYRSLHPFSLPEAVPTPHNLRFRRALRQLDNIVFRVIDERRRHIAAGGDDHGDLLTMLLEARDEASGAGMDDAQLRDEVITLMLAGHETTAVTLSWTWFLLAQHPAIERRVHAELDDVLGGRTPTLDDLPKLPYTRMVIDETLRLYPPAWAIARQATADDEIGGYHIPAGSPIVMSQYVTHRHPAFWDDPETFDPERFTPERVANRPRFAYFPFGGGPRICIGNSFALMEAHLLLATLAQRFRFDRVSGHPVVPEPTVTLRPKHGVLMTLRDRRR